MADRLMIERLRFHCGTASASETTMLGSWSGRIDITAPRRPECSARRASPDLVLVVGRSCSTRRSRLRNIRAAFYDSQPILPADRAQLR